MSIFTWLHLSDLHFRAGGDWDRNIVLHQLLVDIKERMAIGDLRPDLILVSGDVAFSGQPVEYALAKQFFDELLKATGLRKDRLFVVPGNHDVDRKAISRGAAAIAGALTYRTAVNELLTHGEDRRLVLRRQDAYGAFVNEYFAGHLTFDDNSFFYTREIEVAGQQVAILGLNTAWLAAGDEDRGRLALGERQVRLALDATRDAGLRMALLHHPFDWLQEFDRDDCETLLMQGCAFIMHGHLHRTDLLSLTTPDARAMILAAGACYETRQYPNGYNWGRLDFDSGQGTVYLRAYSDRGGGFWTKDVATYKNVPDGLFTFPLSAPTEAKSKGAPVSRTPAVAPARLEANYLGRVQTVANALPLAIIDPRAVERTRRQSMDLLPVYVALNTTTTVPVEDEASPAKKDRRKLVPEGEGARRETRALPALEAAALEHQVVLLGDPGSGKSTFLSHLALCTAGGRLERMGQDGAVPGHDWLSHLGPIWTHGPLLPLQVTLRRFAKSQWCDGTAAGLWGFIEETLASQGLADFAPHVRQELMTGGVLVLLDGLDEVIEPGQRGVVRDAVADFATTYNSGANRYLVTCRGYAYQDPCCQLDRFAVYTLAPFEQEQINRFIDCWYAEACRLGWKEETEARNLAQILQAASTRPDLAPLARNPLQLAMMAALQFSWGRLPDDRVELYAEMVRLLLVRWQEARLGQEAGVTQTISAGDLESALERVAFAAHSTQAGSQGAADISQAILLSVLKDYLDGSWDRAREMVAFIQDRAGLLIDRGNSTYTFPHRSYQEYLAGAYLAVQPDFPDQTADLARENYAQWREVALWAVGAMARLKKMTHVAVDVAAALCPRDAAAEVTDSDEWRTALLAGEALLEIGLKEVMARERYLPVLGRVRRWLVSLIEHGALSPTERASAGNVLGRLGDLRFSGEHLLPEFIAIPVGTFWMGSDAAEVARIKAETGDECKDESPRHQVALDAFALARYPTTNAMFRCFWEAGGYANERWWPDAKAAKVWQPDGTVKDWTNAPRRQPFYWDDGRFSNPSQPIVGVTWYEAVAYCRWLTATLNDGCLYRLPTEAEWERAARGPDGWRYPWGNDWGEGQANSKELNLERTTAVGIFPQGISAEGVLDLAGNVWEWCSDWFDEKAYSRRASRVTSNPAGANSGKYKVLRGGSWYNDKNDVRCAFPRRAPPVSRDVAVGFRVARSSLR